MKIMKLMRLLVMMMKRKMELKRMLEAFLPQGWNIGHACISISLTTGIEVTIDSDSSSRLEYWSCMCQYWSHNWYLKSHLIQIVSQGWNIDHACINHGNL